jgi:TonB family protein
VTGFVDLSSAAAAPPPEPRAEARREEAPAPAPPTPTASNPQRVYGADDEGVIPASPVRQEVPRVPAPIANQTRDRGILEVTIDEQGRVIQAVIRISLHPIYDSQILLAAKEWRYQPATLNGRPVKFRKVIQITITKR